MQLTLSVALSTLPACSRTDDLESARVLVAEATQELGRAQTLHRAGNSEEANEAALRAQEMLRDARDQYLAAEADRSRDVAVLKEFAEFSERMEDYDLAGEAYARAAGLAQARPELWYRAARNFTEARGRYLDRVPGALDAAERMNAGAAEPVSAAVLAAVRGDLYMALGLPADADARYAEALALNATHPRARIGAAAASLRLGDTARSAALADSFVSPSPAESVLLDRTLRAAYLDFRRDRVIVDETAAAHLGLAKVSVRLGFLEEARLAAERAVQLDDSDVFAWNLLGSLARQAGDAERARTAFERSLAIQPEQPRTRQALDELGSAPN